ncbi:helix-turn-helix domain-containing protein [Alkalihalophilus lindianensis]|uniref:Helix-turn-helix domain-containing protein n=1 Tax=Alkalihalophilus lindianensis TaxID=1630542 RepID=A0ABU3XF50_9BACI|nr:helix-turn-helix domain-containing protein [Alkalihalophilus lindianensis]MDV2686527.1 helix-turn-helix domain-containing protein [Alkalihalophilus lindianensis]
MDIHTIGKNIKFYRTLKGLTQNELAEGICTQAQISNIEAGKFIPLSTTLFELSRRLGVDMTHFFHEASNPRYDYIQDFIQDVRKHTMNRNYEQVYDLILAEEKNPLFESVDLQQFIFWHKGFSMAYTTKNYEESLKILFNALNLTYKGKDGYSQEEIQILNAIGVVYDLSGKPHTSVEIYERAIHGTTTIPQLNPKIKVRVYYNYAKAEKSLTNYEKSIYLSEKGIQLCIENELLYLLGECLYQKGYCLILTNQHEEGKKYIQDAIYLFRIEGKLTLAAIAEKQMKEAIGT